VQRRDEPPDLRVGIFADAHFLDGVPLAEWRTSMSSMVAVARCSGSTHRFSMLTVSSSSLSQS
jgi:hypothetical protein